MWREAESGGEEAGTLHVPQQKKARSKQARLFPPPSPRRYIPGVSARAPGGEDLLLDEFEKMGIACDGATQLVVLCEVCGRPSTKVRGRAGR